MGDYSACQGAAVGWQRCLTCSSCVSALPRDAAARAPQRQPGALGSNGCREDL